MTLAAILSVGSDNKDAIRVVLDALRNSVDDGAVSWMKLSVEATMSAPAANEVDSKAEASGMQAKITDL